jgi:hypothetical protein
LTDATNPKVELTETLFGGFRRYLGNAVNTLAVKLMLAKVYASKASLPVKQAIPLSGGAAASACFSSMGCLFKNQVSIGRVVGIFPDIWLGWGCLWSVECSGRGRGMVVCGVVWLDGVD